MKIDRQKQFLSLVVFMILYVVFGTLLHESGHILIAHCLNYSSLLHYGSMVWYLPNGEIGTNKTHSFYITLGGVIIIDVISLIALSMLVIFKTKLHRVVYWVLVFLAMLIYRHILLTLIGVSISAIQQTNLRYGSDEAEIASFLSVDNSVIGVPFLIIALISCHILFYQVLEPSIRKLFFWAMVVGGVLGYILWLFLLGPILMP